MNLYYYLWIEGIHDREAMTIYTDLVKAMETAEIFKRDGWDVQVRNARTGELVAE